MSVLAAGPAYLENEKATTGIRQALEQRDTARAIEQIGALELRG